MILILLSPAMPPAGPAQGRIRSEHVWIRIPSEREWLGRETITRLEECWRYVHRVTDGSLPRMVVVEVDWSAKEPQANFEGSGISIGMGHPSAQADLKEYLLHHAAREMALLGLDQMTRGATRRQENLSLAGGMAEILAREFDLSTKALASAWTVAHLLSRMGSLTLESLTAPMRNSTVAGGPGALSPAVTFLLSCREQYGREKTLKLIEALRKGGLEEAIHSTFRASPAVVEAAWIERLRRVEPPAEQIVTSAVDAPSLNRIELVPPVVPRGEKVAVYLHLADAGGDLDPQFVFLVDDSGSVYRGRDAGGSSATGILIEVPVGRDRHEGGHGFKVFAVDGAGNLRSWDGKYEVSDRPPDRH